MSFSDLFSKLFSTDSSKTHTVCVHKHDESFEVKLGEPAKCEVQLRRSSYPKKIQTYFWKTPIGNIVCASPRQKRSFNNGYSFSALLEREDKTFQVLISPIL